MTGVSSALSRRHRPVPPEPSQERPAVFTFVESPPEFEPEPEGDPLARSLRPKGEHR